VAQQNSVTIQKPRADERPLWDLLEAAIGTYGLLVAHNLKLFPFLAEQPRTLQEVCDALKIVSRPADALLTLCVSAGLLRVQDGRYSLTSLAEDYLLEGSSTYFGGFLDLLIAIDSSGGLSVEAFKKAVLTNSPQTEVLDLSAYQLLLDIGGGSGAHCIGATLRWPNLQAVVYDLAPVCEVAEEYIARYGLQGRVRTQAGDMWSDAFPSADLHFYSNIYHDWPPEKGRLLTQKSFESLEPGGRLVIHEVLYDHDKTGPLTVAAANMVMLLAVEGQQYSGRGLCAMLAGAGFVDIEVKPTCGYWSIVTGRKAWLTEGQTGCLTLTPTAPLSRRGSVLSVGLTGGQVGFRQQGRSATAFAPLRVHRYRRTEGDDGND